MQTMWNQTNFVMLRLVAILILTISGPAAAGCEYSKIEIDSHNKFINAYNKEGKIKNFILGKIIRNLAASSDDIHFVDTKIVSIENQDLLVAVFRTPSNAHGRSGFCGSGHEDYLVAIKLKGDTAELLDKKIIQSCLNSISLFSDNGDDPSKAISPADPPEIAHFQLMSPPSFAVKNMAAVIEQGKIKTLEK
ncbi:hypothetical protein WMO33_15375 [Xanthomonas oryzae pv. oryzicola]|uniref:hypothetical protein n=1 Tax=Xanthomonas oryzae TaxID=347 RepID=UPI000ABC711A|nr:hypothetical protein [Xanthomonas oryzae]ULX23740.1 hypothetical protein IYN96_15365 [Xanthomonas oryzae pv. oryzicola]UNW41778.1 hypothetical protein H4J00_15570 [Xanthomonas oryzae pv. oryzicola]